MNCRSTVALNISPSRMLFGPTVEIFSETAIPTGQYEVNITLSPRFKLDLPLLKSVTGFDGIRVHFGN